LVVMEVLVGQAAQLVEAWAEMEVSPDVLN
jgi:hypothetical protein